MNAKYVIELTTQSTKIDQRKVDLAMLGAENAGVDGVVFLLDQERSDRSAFRGRLLQRVQAFRRGGTSIFGVAIGVPSRCLETWLLADDVARKDVLGAGANSPFGGDPEDRPPPPKLKAYLAAKCREANLGPWEARMMLAASSEPSTLGRRCPRSYAPFAVDVTSEIKPLFSAAQRPDPESQA